MNSFDPASLSPLPRQPHVSEPCELPYGLAWEDLQAILPNFDPEERSSAQAFVSHDKQGISGGENSCILRLQYSIGKGRLGSETVFVKQSIDTLKREAQKYQFLEERGIPVPRLLAVIQKGEVEVILLEFLSSIGIDFSSQIEVDDLLYLVAELNAIQKPPAIFNPPPGLPQAEFDEFVRTALEGLGRDPAVPSLDAQGWFDAYQVSQKTSRGMPLALNHNEFYFQQVGWAQRESARRLVLFDLESMAVTPRFADIATILHPLSVYSGREQNDLFKVYLDRLQQRTQHRLDFKEALREFRFLRITQSCYTLPWLFDEAGRPESGIAPEILPMLVRCMQEDMNELGLL